MDFNNINRFLVVPTYSFDSARFGSLFLAFAFKYTGDDPSAGSGCRLGVILLLSREDGATQPPWEVHQKP